MSDTQIDQSIIDAVNFSRSAVMDHDTILASGAGKAYQSVAQTAAIAIQDAADTLRNISTIATTAAGVALAQYLATKDPTYNEVLQASLSTISTATTDFSNIGAAATTIMQNFNSAG